MGDYLKALTESMTMLGKHGALFLGQSIVYDGQRMHETFSGVPLSQKIEMPVAEDFQMGFCTGLSLQGFLPVCVFPRMDFLVLAANQLVNHLDKFRMMSNYKPKVIIRTAIGSSHPFNPGPQHCGDYADAFERMLTTVVVVKLRCPQSVRLAYQNALERPESSLLIEYASEYGT